MTTEFFIENKGILKYNSLELGADGYSNNQCVGTWTSYITKNSKKCDWGDFRIPESDKLDVGAGEFIPDEKFAKFGWDNYLRAFEEGVGYRGQTESTIKQAIFKEKEQWWK
jgi:hypothetical protein